MPEKKARRAKQTAGGSAEGTKSPRRRQSSRRGKSDRPSGPTQAVRIKKPSEGTATPKKIRDSRERPARAARRGRDRRDNSLKGRILALVGSQPLDKMELSRKLEMPVDDRHSLRRALVELEQTGEIVRIRKSRYVLPQEADLFTGTIQIHPSGTAHVINEVRGGADLFVSAENTWTAMHGDKVVARIVRDSIPGRPTARREGRVIRILSRANETIVGTLQSSRNFFYVVADDPRFVHNLYVPEPQDPLRARVGDKVVARLEDWPSRHVNPEGRIVEVLGRTGAPGVDILSIIRKYRLPEGFPDDVVREAEKIAPEVPAREAERREDLRMRPIITIDPDDARDFDDAIEVQRTRKGWSVAIHIADVSHYVRPKSRLDREAAERGNSVYLPDRVLPMLPEALSNGICSLKPGVDRLAFSVFADVSRVGKISNPRFARTVIRSAARLTYKEAYAILQKPPSDEISERVHVAWEASSCLRKKRFENGSLDLDFPEVKVWVDPSGRPVRLERIENDESHQLIEELMLLANEVVARELKLARQPAVYRIHEDPDPDKLAEYAETVETYGLPTGDLTKRENLRRLLLSVRGQPYEHAVKIGLLKSLKRAAYDTAPLGHYGLAKSDYTHFTSPIRRYADLIVHRALERHLGLTKSGPSSSELGPVAEHISTTERIAADAEREASKLKKLEYFQSQLVRGATFHARIVDVRNYGLLVELPDVLVTGLVHVSSLPNDFYHFEPSRGRFVGRKSRKSYRLGDTIEVMVARVDMFKQQVDFQPV